MRLSLATNAAVAALIGFAVTLPLIFQAGTAIGASGAQIAMFVAVSCFAVAAESAFLSWRYKIPVVCAFSTAGLALIGASSGFTIAEAAGALTATGLMIAVTGLVRPVTTLVAKIPGGIAAGMLAGVLLPFVLAAARAGQADPGLVLPLALLYFAMRLWNGAYAILAVLAAGIALTVIGDEALALPAPALPEFEVFVPALSLPSLVGIAIPLYLVTMASQNLPGMAVLRANGYDTPASPLVTWTGITGVVLAPFGGFAFNLAAITAAICMSPNADPDPARRYLASVWAGVFYLLTGIFGATTAALFGALPNELVLAIAGLALLGPVGSSLSDALSHDQEREAALLCFLMTASGVSLFGLGSALWGLALGLVTLHLGRVAGRA